MPGPGPPVLHPHAPSHEAAVSDTVRMFSKLATRFQLPTRARPGNERSRLAVDQVSDAVSLRQLQPAWDRLVEKSGIDGPFVSHEWICSWWECFGAGKQLRVLVVSEDGEAIAIVPLMLSVERINGMRVRRLGSLYNEHVPRFDFIIARDAPEVYRAVLDHLRASRDRWDVLELCQLTYDTPTLTSMEKLARGRGMRTGVWDAGHAPYLRIEGEWKRFHDGLPGKFRYKLRNRLKKLGQQGEVRLETVTSTDHLDRALKDGLEIEAAAWKGSAGTAIASRPDLRAFYRSFAVKAAQRGWLHLDFLTVDGRRIAFAYTISYAGKLFLLKPGYDPGYASFSPGILLFAKVLEAAFRGGVSEYDFLGRDDKWKLEWTGLVRRHKWLLIFSGSLRGAALYAVKFVLAPRVRDRWPFTWLLRARGKR